MSWPSHSDVSPDEERGGFGRGDPQRVDDDDLGGARVDSRLVRAAKELEVGAGAVDAEEGDADPVPDCKRDGRADPLQHRLGRHAQRAQLAVRDRALDHGGADAELDERLDVRLHRPGEAPHFGAQPCLGDEANGSEVVIGDAREAGLDPVDACGVDRAGELELVLGREHDAHRLLAVAQGRVIEADDDVRLRLECLAVEVARPDFLAVDRHARTIPSGKGESFSVPASVIRKLSSTRSPPPPSL